MILIHSPDGSTSIFWCLIARGCQLSSFWKREGTNTIEKYYIIMCLPYRLKDSTERIYIISMWLYDNSILFYSILFYWKKSLLEFMTIIYNKVYCIFFCMPQCCNYIKITSKSLRAKSQYHFMGSLLQKLWKPAKYQGFKCHHWFREILPCVSLCTNSAHKYKKQWL